MCWSATASVAMVAAGGVGAAITLRRGDPAAIWATLGFFTVMEGLQATGYAVIDQCGSPANRTITILSYLHIALQPLFINAFAMAIAPVRPGPQVRRWVWALAGLASAVLFLRLVPLPALGFCVPGEVLCGPAWCLRSGEWHIAWEVPLNGLPTALGIPFQFPSYMLAVFALPLVYGAWRFVLFHAAAGPLLASLLTRDPNEMPAIWCLFSIGILAIALSPFIRHKVMRAHVPGPAHI
ncbi:DUF5765 domain-containing protein [Ovoidimarina sediminis]|uniref:DUF5765 domain-containing protein n=1 Tax=Ovoidimarina sediminis TaxID=3079856 RepID=UPI0029062235|nr:DUF5765 domain-containing protein [Rhodophyticola sp. MJ-SS7]MDU8943841.1 DUF5765 domain-containing protein [Rhodophyticola sp. MJ-SS7]